MEELSRNVATLSRIPSVATMAGNWLWLKEMVSAMQNIVGKRIMQLLQ